MYNNANISFFSFAPQTTSRLIRSYFYKGFTKIYASNYIGLYRDPKTKVHF